MPDNRFTFRTHHSFATRSNKNRLVRTPGGRLSVQHVQKKTGHHTCGDTGAKLNGIPALTSNKFKALSKNKKTVARAYGGVLSGGAVRSRIIRAFLVEERKVVKKVQKAQPLICSFNPLRMPVKPPVALNQSPDTAPQATKSKK